MNAIRQKGRAGFVSGVWIAPLSGLLILTVLFSLRLLSDPDLGFHLNAGRWIIHNLSIPQTDIATYTVPDHEYIDLHWLFQVFIFAVFKLTGYQGLSILVCLLVCTLFFLTYRRLVDSGVPYPTTIPMLFVALLIMEPRFFLRPELFTYLFFTLTLIVLQKYYEKRRIHLFILPLIMLVWCNMEALFILGFSLIWAYFIGLWIRDRKPDLRLLGWGMVTAMVCLINPYGLKGLLFPFELLSRFQSGNIFHEHIKEFRPLFQLENWSVKEFASLAYMLLSAGTIFITLKQRKPHEIILWVVYGILGLVAIRNIPLFIIVSLPITAQAISGIVRQTGNRIRMKGRKSIELLFASILMLFILLLIPRVITNTYYANNFSYNKTGIGLDRLQQPEAVAEFMLSNHLDGRIINSLSYGGWFSWRLSQPVFIDARLEVIREELYAELAGSWTNGLEVIIDKYQPDMLVYDYSRYFSWTPQLLKLPGWYPIFLNGQSVVFARKGYVNTNLIPDSANILTCPDTVFSPSQAEKIKLLAHHGPSGFSIWLQGFYKRYECIPIVDQNIASFFLQMKNNVMAEKYFLKTLKGSCGSAVSCYYALAGIYSEAGNLALAETSYRRILEFDPDNEAIKQSIQTSLQKPVKNLKGLTNCLADAEATKHFNNGNLKYKAGDIIGAIAEYSEAIRHNPMHSKAFLNKGFIEAVELKDFNSAINDFNSAINLDPEFADAYLGRGSSRYSIHDMNGALEDWKKAESLGNDQARGLLLKHQR